MLKFDIKAHSVKNAAGNWEGLYVQVNVWHGLEQWDGMLQKGDYVTVYARELKSREYNGKTYYNVDADDIQPGGRYDGCPCRAGDVPHRGGNAL